MTLRKSGKLIGVFMVMIIAVGVLRLSAYADSGTQLDLYVDGTKSAVGAGTVDSPFNNMESAMAAVLAATEDEYVIWIMGEISISGNVTWDFSPTAYEHVTLKRYEDYEGIMVNITSGSTLTFTGAVMDGNKEAVTATKPMIEVSGTLALNDMWLRNNKAPSAYGGAVYVGRTGQLECENTQITGNEARYGGGIEIDEGIGNIKNSTISGNIVSEYGGGVMIFSEQSTAKVAIENSHIDDNEADGGGGGISMAYGGELEVEFGSVSRNKAGRFGGGISVEEGSMQLTDVEIDYNEAGTHGGGVYTVDPLTINGGSISNNKAGLNGDGSGSGGGIYAGSKLIMTAASISSNEASEHGGGVYAGAAFEMNGGNISNNVLTTSGTKYYGGGVYLNGNQKFDMEAGAITGNKGGNGGGIYASDGCVITCTQDSQISNNNATNGGGVYLQGASLSVADSEICGNEASYGGGIQVMVGAVVEVDKSRINGNTATGNGGAAYSYSSSSNACKITITDSELNGNKANNGGGIHTSGSTTCIISGGTMSGNTATAGGAIYTEMTSYSYVRPDGVEFSGNKADTGYYWTVDDSASSGYSYTHRRYVANCSYSTGPDNLSFTNAYNNYDIYYTGAEAELGKAVTAVVNTKGESQSNLTTASPGDLVTYTITYRNATAGRLLDVTITDMLPEHTELTAVDPDSGYLLYEADGSVTNSFAAARKITWNIGAMAYNTSATIKVTVRILAAASGEITNTADMDYQLIKDCPGQTDSEMASLDVVKTTAAISLYYYKETEKGAATTWELFDPQPEPEPYYEDLGSWFEIPDTVSEGAYSPYYFTLSSDGHDERFYFLENTGFTAEEDVEVFVYYINTIVDIKVPGGNFLWYANAGTKNGDGTYEIRSAEYEIINDSPSRFMDFSVTVDAFTEAENGRTELQGYEDQIQLDLYVTNWNGTQMTSADGLAGIDLLSAGNSYQGTYSDALKSGFKWYYRFTGNFDAPGSTQPLPAEGAVSDYVLKLTFER